MLIQTGYFWHFLESKPRFLIQAHHWPLPGSELFLIPNMIIHYPFHFRRHNVFLKMPIYKKNALKKLIFRKFPRSSVFEKFGLFGIVKLNLSSKFNPIIPDVPIYVPRCKYDNLDFYVYFLKWMTRDEIISKIGQFD